MAMGLLHGSSSFGNYMCGWGCVRERGKWGGDDRPVLMVPCIYCQSHMFLYSRYHFRDILATRSSTLAWKVPQTEGPGRLSSVGSQRVGHGWVTSLSLCACKLWTELLLSKYCSVRLKTFTFYVFVWTSYKPVTVQYCVASCVNWTPRLTLLDF